MDKHERDLALYDALAQLPAVQARRIYQHYILGKSKAEIAAAEGVGKSRVCCSIERGLASLKNMLKNDLVKLAGITQRTKPFARTFSANVAPEQVYREEINKISGLDHFRTACALLGEDKLSEEELGILRSIIDERLKR